MKLGEEVGYAIRFEDCTYEVGWYGGLYPAKESGCHVSS